MGNANGREDQTNNDVHHSSVARSNGGDYASQSHPLPPGLPTGRVASPDLMSNSPPASPSLSRSPLLFAPQVPVAPLQMNGAPPFSNQMRQIGPEVGVGELPTTGRGIPTLITWSYGGNDVAVEGSWDNWTSRKTMQRSGTDHCILLVLPSGIFHYKIIVDGEQRYIPDLPFVADEMDNVCNILDVHDYEPENPDSVSEFEAPPSPDSSYGQAFPREEDFAKEPVVVPSQLHLTVLGSQNSDEASPPPPPPPSSSSSSPPAKPQHVVLNHLYMEKGWASRSVVALGLTHRIQSKYVTVVLYKPLKR